MGRNALHMLTGLSRFGYSGFFEPPTLRIFVDADSLIPSASLPIFLHEYIHYWHATGTTYGNHVALFRHLQSILVYECLKELVEKLGSEKNFNLWVTLRDWRSDLGDGPVFLLIDHYLSLINL